MRKLKIYFFVLLLSSCTIEKEESILSEGNYDYFTGTKIQINDYTSSTICESLIECKCEYQLDSSHGQNYVRFDVQLGNNVSTPVISKLYAEESLISTDTIWTTGSFQNLNNYVYPSYGKKTSIKIFLTDANSRTVFAECEKGNQLDIMTYISY